MTSAIEERVRVLGEQVINRQLPVLIGLMAEAGKAPEEQRRRATRLVECLQGIEVAPTLQRDGRPVAVELDEEGLRINGQMAERVDDGALVGALADPVARLLDISSVSVGLVLRMEDVPQLRGLVGELERRIDQELVAITDLEALVRQRVARFEERMVGLAKALGGELVAPAVDQSDLVGVIVEKARAWPEWRRVIKSRHLQAWQQGLGEALKGSYWEGQEAALAQMVWQSLGVSSTSALRRAAQQVRSMEVAGAEGRKLLEALAPVCGLDEEVDDGVEAWPAYEGLAEAWERLVRREDAILGARSTAERPRLSVFEAPGISTGLNEPSSLPWSEPLLCWTTRETDALGDLLEGTEMSLGQQRQVVTGARVQVQRLDVDVPFKNEGGQQRWSVQVPRRLVEVDEGYAEAVEAAYGALFEAYMAAFDALDAPMKQRAVQMAQGTFSGFLSTTADIWKRRIALPAGTSTRDKFKAYLEAPTRVLEWPLFVDVFDALGEGARLTTMPRLTIPAVWQKGAKQAPVWIPVEAIGEAIGQAPLRIRNVIVDSDQGVVRALGDHDLKETDLRSLPSVDVFKALHEGALLLTVQSLS